MVTEKECREALKVIISRGGDIEDLFYWTSAMLEEIKTLNSLIDEHFSNPPLKFEELKPNMWVWDNEMKEWIQIVHLTNFLGATKFVNFYINGLSELIDSEYEPNRFYRKEAQK